MALFCFKNSMKAQTCVLALSLFLSACSSTDEDAYVERSLDSLYHEGMTYLKEKKYEKAAKSFDEIERQHPYSDWAAQAQLMAAYAYYLEQKYEKSLTALETFIHLHPAHTDVPYAYYLKGLCYYEQISTVERDQKITELAFVGFDDLMRRFPHSRYAKDARYKIDLLRDMLAAKEMQVGRYYQNKNAPVAALNRFKVVIEHYQTTSHIEEALHRLVEVYLSLGLKDEAKKAAAVLGHNFPGGDWYADTYRLVEGLEFSKNNDISWLDSVVFKKKEKTFAEYAPEDVARPPAWDIEPVSDASSVPGDSREESTPEKQEDDKSWLDSARDFISSQQGEDISEE